MIAAVGSFIGGTVSILGLMFIAPPLAKVMIAIGPSVEVVLMLLALSVITLVSAGSRLKTALMVVLGLLLGSIGPPPGSFPRHRCRGLIEASAPIGRFVPTVPVFRGIDAAASLKLVLGRAEPRYVRRFSAASMPRPH